MPSTLYSIPAMVSTRVNRFAGAAIVALFAAIPGPAALAQEEGAVQTEAVTQNQPATPGKLLIVGGGLRSDNQTTYKSFFEHYSGEGPICIIPTASATPRESAANAERDLRRHGPEPLEIVIIELSREDPARANDVGAASQIRSCAALWFTGGDQSRITRVFRPAGRDTAALIAAREVLASGGLIAGSSAGAAMMSDPMITGGSSRDWLKRVGDDAAEQDSDETDGELPPAERLRTGYGLGFFPYGTIDQHFLARGRLGRLVLALEANDIQRGYGIADNRAMQVDLDSHGLQGLGAAAVVIVDVGSLERDRGWHKIRLSLLGDGDTMNAQTGEITPASGKVRSELPINTASNKAAGEPEKEKDADLEPWSRDAILMLLRQLAADPSSPVFARDSDVELRLSADERTRFFASPDRPEDLCIVDVQLDILLR